MKKQLLIMFIVLTGITIGQSLMAVDCNDKCNKDCTQAIDKQKCMAEYLLECRAGQTKYQVNVQVADQQIFGKD